MSGIYGMVRFDQRPIDADSEVGGVRRIMTPWGPDRRTEQSRAGVLLGHLLRRITPEDASDRQPATDHEAGLTLVADLRLDNREDLAAALDMSPAECAAAPDSALLLGACVRWGERAWEHLVGACAGAVWDARRQYLVLARDAMGERPLYYHLDARRIVFASAVRAVLAFPDVPRRLNEIVLLDHLLLNWSDPEATAQQGILRLPPGCTLTVSAAHGTAQQRCYYTACGSAPELRRATQDTCVEALREALERAVHRRTRSAAAVASHLSAGLDSAAVTCAAARQLGARNLPLYAVTLGTPADQDGVVPHGRFADEAPLAAQVANRHPAIHHAVLPFPASPLLEDLAAITTGAGGLIPIAYGYATYRATIEHAARCSANVLLGGFAGNATFSSGGEYGAVCYVYRGLWRTAFALVLGHARARPMPLWRSFASLVAYQMIKAAALRLSISLPRGGPAVHGLRDVVAIRPEVLARHDLFRRAYRRGTLQFLSGVHQEPRGRLLAMVRRSGWWPDMWYGFKATLGVEVRDPLADRGLVELCLSIPPERFMAGGRSRALARAILAGQVPAELLADRRRGFQSANWMARFQAGIPLMLLLLERFKRSPAVCDLLDVPKLEALVRAFVPPVTWDHPFFERYYLFTPLAFQVGLLLARQESGGDPVDGLAGSIGNPL
ncbi:MAG: hypothetical protein HYV63_31595 [Candidatus Schekmanbacteria bacterium]|nr:hypothetical protein [Candidatus Schekmanbacteria bacterium]